MTDHTIAVVGGGITGLSAALTLNRESPGTRVLLFEASERLGGKLHTLHLDGIQMEAGADSFIVRDERFLEFCRTLGIAGELIEPAIFSGMLRTEKGLLPFPTATMLGVPLSVRTALRSSRILSLRGRLRALADLVLPGPLKGPDVTVGSFIRRRFGSEVLERMVDPLLAGTRAGAPDEMSLAAALGPIDAIARSSRSVMRGYRAGGGPPRFLTHRAGISGLTGAIAGELRAEVRTSAHVDRISESGDGLRVVAGGESWDCDAAIVCLPGGPASAVIEDLAPEAARLLATIKHASAASIALAFPASDIPAPPGSGVLVPTRATSTISAATWWSLKWPHAAPQDRFVVRAFVGRAGHHPSLELPDGELVESALDDLRSMIPLPGDPVLTDVTRWPDALPQYEVGHLDKVRDIETALPRSLAVAGADLRGSGIPDCHDQGVTAARQISRALVHR